MREEGEAREGGARGGCGGGGGGGGGEVQEGVVGGEVVAVVDAREVVEVGVLQEGEAVETVHEGVERGEGEEGGAKEDDALPVKECNNRIERPSKNPTAAGFRNTSPALSLCPARRFEIP